MLPGGESWWCWGRTVDFPGPEVRLGLARLLQERLGTTVPLAVREAPPVDALPLAPSRLVLPSGLEAMAGASVVDRARHAFGRSFLDLVHGLEGDLRGAPDAVLHPRTESEVEQVLAWAHEHGVAVVPFGGGTSVVGGVWGPRERAWVSLDLKRLDAVLEVDPVSRSARIQAGATGPRLEEQLAPHGLSLRFYPQSFAWSTLGGWIATRAGGHHATGPTRIDDFVQAARMLTPTGVWQGPRVPSSGAGPCPDRWVLGSEGTLGVVTEAWLRVVPRPTFRSRAEVTYSRWDQGFAAVRAIAGSGLLPANCRLLDAGEAELHGVLPPGTGRCVLLLAFESSTEPRVAWMDAALDLALQAGGTCARGARHLAGEQVRSQGPEEAWRRAFFAGPALQAALVSVGVLVDTFETAITWERFAELHLDVVASVRAALVETCGAGLVTCRITHAYPDGPAPYYTFLAPAGHSGLARRWHEVKAAANEALARHGATITHHHGVGRLHQAGWRRERPEPFGRALQAVKRELDPRGVLNPGLLTG